MLKTNLRTLIPGADKIHEENFKRYNSNKDKYLSTEASNSYEKGFKIVLSIIEDIKDTQTKRQAFNDYAKYVDKQIKEAKTAINGSKKLIKELQKCKKISLIQQIIMFILTITLILKGI